MPSSFFLPKGSKKRKGSQVKNAGNGSKKKRFQLGGKGGKFKTREKDDEPKRTDFDDEEILSEGSDVEGDPDAGYLSSDNDAEAEETAEEKRLRLAKLYLEEIEKVERERLLDANEEKEEEDLDLSAAVNKRLKKDDLEEAGKLKRLIANNYQLPDNLLVDLTRTKMFKDNKVHKASVTCVAVSTDGRFVMSGSKDGGLVIWRFKEATCDLSKIARFHGGRKGHEEKHLGHCSSVNAVAISSDNKFFVSCDDSNLIHVWKLADEEESAVKVHTFKGHRSPVSGLAFRRGSHTLFSCSHDRSVKLWNLDEMVFVETLFGHQDRITGIDSGLRERAVTAGGRDGSVRIWKIVEESQLVYNAPSVASGGPSGAGSTATGSVDAVKLLDEEHFVTCGEDGHLSLWGVMKKKPLCTVKNAHGEDATNGEPLWVSSLATLHNTDLVASGSHDGLVRLWKSDPGQRKISQISAINLGSVLHPEDAEDAEEPPGGFVNSIAIHPNQKSLILAVGQEHRLGRWWRYKKPRNGILVIGLSPNESSEGGNFSNL